MYVYYFHYSEKSMKECDSDSFVKRHTRKGRIADYVAESWAHIGHIAVYEYNTDTNSLIMRHPEIKEVSIKRLSWLTLVATDLG